MFNAEKTSRALCAYMAGEAGAIAPRVATLNDLYSTLQVISAGMSKGELSLERSYLAAALAVYARTNPDASATKALNDVCAASPLPGSVNVAKQRKTCVLAALQAHAERFAPASRTDDAALIAEAMDYARGVDCRAERDARAAANKAKREGKAEGETQAETVSPANPTQALVEALARSLEALTQAADAGDLVAEAELQKAFATLTARFKPAKGRKSAPVAAAA